MNCLCRAKTEVKFLALIALLLMGGCSIRNAQRADWDLLNRTAAIAEDTALASGAKKVLASEIRQKVNANGLQYPYLIEARQWLEQQKQTQNTAKALCYLDAAFYEFNHGRSRGFARLAFDRALGDAATKPQNSKLSPSLLASEQKVNIAQSHHAACQQALIACAEVAIEHAHYLEQNGFAANEMIAFAEKIANELSSMPCQEPPMPMAASPVARPSSLPSEAVAREESSQWQAEGGINGAKNNQEKATMPSDSVAVVNQKPLLAEEAPVLKIEKPMPASNPSSATLIVTPTALKISERIWFHFGQSGVGDIQHESAIKIEAIAKGVINGSLKPERIVMSGFSAIREKNPLLAKERELAVLRYFHTLLSGKIAQYPLISLASQNGGAQPKPSLKPSAKGEQNFVDLEIILP